MCAGVQILTLLTPDLHRDLAWVVTHDMLSAGIPLKDFPEHYQEFPPSEDMHQRLIELDAEGDFFTVLSKEEIQKFFYREKDTVEFAYLDREGSFSVSPEPPEDAKMIEAVYLGPDGLKEGTYITLHGRELSFFGEPRSKGCTQCEEIEVLEGPEKYFFLIDSPEFANLTSYQHGNVTDADPVRLRWLKRGDKYRLDYVSVRDSEYRFRDLMRISAFAHNQIEIPFRIGEYRVSCQSKIIFMEKI